MYIGQFLFSIILILLITIFFGPGLLHAYQATTSEYKAAYDVGYKDYPSLEFIFNILPFTFDSSEIGYIDGWKQASVDYESRVSANKTEFFKAHLKGSR